MNLPATTIASLVTDEATARRIADGFGELFAPEEIAASAFEITDPGALPTAFRRPTRPERTREGAMGTLMADDDLPWQLELVFSEKPDEAQIRALIGDLAGEPAAGALVFSEVAARDWVAASLEGLNPVSVGRFVVHGRHDRAFVKPNQIGIEIEAGLAFGTGHHGTTLGCLGHFDALLKRRRPRRIVDIGTGTGVLAIAAARALKRHILAGEIDPDSVAISRANARLNGAGAFLRPVRSAGLRHSALARRRHYDLVFANILARPLRLLAPQIGQATRSGSELILSGLLACDVAGVLAAYAAQGFRLAARRDIEGWASLRLIRRRR